MLSGCFCLLVVWGILEETRLVYFLFLKQIHLLYIQKYTGSHLLKRAMKIQMLQEEI